MSDTPSLDTITPEELLKLGLTVVEPDPRTMPMGPFIGPIPPGVPEITPVLRGITSDDQVMGQFGPDMASNMGGNDPMDPSNMPMSDFLPNVIGNNGPSILTPDQPYPTGVDANTPVGTGPFPLGDLNTDNAIQAPVTILERYTF